MSKEQMMRLTRLLNKWYANLFGYFWLPCRMCGEMHGGHEWHGSACIVETEDDGEHAMGVCDACDKRLHGQWLKRMPDGSLVPYERHNPQFMVQVRP